MSVGEEEGVEVAVAAVHELEGAEKEENVARAVEILNFEWPLVVKLFCRYIGG